MDGSGHPLPLEWPHPGPYGYDPYTNTLMTLPYYGYGFGVECSWIPMDQQHGPIPPPYFSSSVPLGRRPMAGAQGRGGRHAQRGRGGRHRFSAPRQHGGAGLLGSDPSSQPPAQVQPRPVPVPLLSGPGLLGSDPSSQPPAQVQPRPVPAAPLPSEKRNPTPPPPAQVQPRPVPVPLPSEKRDPTPPPPASSSPSSHAMTPPVSDSVKKSRVVDVSMTASAKMDDGRDDVLVGLSGSGTATTGKKRLLPLDPPAPLKNSNVHVSMAHRDDRQGDVLGLNSYMASKRLLSKKALSLPADAEEEAKDAARKKTRLGWGQGLAKYENRLYKKDDETTNKLAAQDGAISEAAYSHVSSPPLGSKGHGENNSLDRAEMRVSQVTTAPALLSKASSCSLTGDLSDPGKNGSISSLTKKAVSTSEMPARFSCKHNQNLMADGSNGDPKVYDVPRKDSPPPEDNSMTAVAAQASSSQGCDAQPDESSITFTKVPDVPPRMPKIFVKMAQKPKKILPKNVLSDVEPETDDLQGSKLKEWSQEAQKCLPSTVVQSEENCCNENAAPLVSGIATVTPTKIYGRMNAKAEDVKMPKNQICHEPTANLIAHSLPDKGYGESSMDEHEHAIGKVLVGESNAAPSRLGLRSSQAACLAISKTESPVFENFNEDSCSNEAVCITKSSSKVKENVPQSVLIANHGDEGNCVVDGSCGQDIFKITFFPDERSAKLANGTIKDDQIRSGAKTAELCSSLKECNDTAKHHSWKATEKKLDSSNIDDGRTAPSDMKNPNSKDNPCITSDPAAMLTGPEFVQHMMEIDEAMEKLESEKNDDKIKDKDNLVLFVASKHGSGQQLSCEVNSQKEMEKIDNIPSPEGNDLNADMETPTKDSCPCAASNASVIRDDGLIQRLRASEAMYGNSENNDAKVETKKGNHVHSVASKASIGIQLSCNVNAQKGKGIMPSPEVNDLNAPPMQISYGTPNTYHLPSSSVSAALDMVHANSSYVAMDIDLNIPLDMTPLDVTLVDLGSSTAEASTGRSSEATDSDATLEISPPQTTTTVTQTAQQQPANQPGSIWLFGRVIYQAPSTGTTNHTPNQGNQTVVSTSNMPSNPVVPVISRRGPVQLYSSMATTSTGWRSGVPNNQQGQPAMLPNRILYGSSTNGASASVASPLQLQPGSSTLANLMNQHHRQQALANINPYIMRGGVPVVPSPHLIQGSSGGAGLINFNGFNSVQQQWPFPVVDTSRVVLGYSFYLPGATTNQAPATVTTMLSIGRNNGEGASTSNNARAPPAAGRGRGRGRGGHNPWLSLGRN